MKQDKHDSPFTVGEVEIIKKANLKVALVIADFYKDITDELTRGAMLALNNLAGFGLTGDIFRLMGALEIPSAIAQLDSKPDNKYDIYIALGAVVRGETSHYDVVANLSAQGLMELGIYKKIIIGNGILTVDTIEQAWARADMTSGNKGGFAVQAALRLWLASNNQ
ncbi:MAG: 6,7-dimethyl-8-ribityllumazine synthase [Hydrotalea sp.]|nr:6,7-dimethyl-8-ribityllumazine synthase [Hydrotalea sp.]